MIGAITSIQTTSTFGTLGKGTLETNESLDTIIADPPAFLPRSERKIT